MIKLLNLLTEAKDAFQEFATTRMNGAEKIANTAQEKGGASMLTWHHFKVKLPYYKKAAEGKFDRKQAINEFASVKSSISLNMSATEFQKEVGKLEVLGELIIKSKK
jgi:hypothetical protein